MAKEKKYIPFLCSDNLDSEGYSTIISRVPDMLTLDEIIARGKRSMYREALKRKKETDAGIDLQIVFEDMARAFVEEFLK